MSYQDEEITSAGKAARVRPVERESEDVEDLRELCGRLMALCVKNEQSAARIERKVDELLPFASDVIQMRRDWDQDREKLVHGASQKAAAHSSNRMAALLGALFTLYEVSAPYLHEVWRMVHK